MHRNYSGLHVVEVAPAISSFNSRDIFIVVNIEPKEVHRSNMCVCNDPYELLSSFMIELETDYRLGWQRSRPQTYRFGSSDSDDSGQSCCS